jgi:hypothetical protein
VLRTSNAYVFHDPKIAAQQGRPSNTDFRCGPPDAYKNGSGARLNGARVTRGEPPRGPPVPMSASAIAPRSEHGSAGGAKLSAAERAAIVARMDAGTATPADWAAWKGSL